MSNVTLAEATIGYQDGEIAKEIVWATVVNDQLGFIVAGAFTVLTLKNKSILYISSAALKAIYLRKIEDTE